jgi:hypothetical protein
MATRPLPIFSTGSRLASSRIVRAATSAPARATTPRLRIYRLHRLYSRRAWGSVDEHELVNQVVLTVGTLDRLRSVQNPHQEGRLLCPPDRAGLGVQRAASVGSGGARISPGQRDGAKQCPHYEHHRHHLVRPSASQAFPPPYRGAEGEKFSKPPAPACYSLPSVEAGARHVYRPGGHILALASSCPRE